MIKHLSIDIETYSSVDIRKGGLYKYVASPDFEILLIAYALDGAQVQLIDLAQGEEAPNYFKDYLLDRSYIKSAYNAAFEWRCLSKVFGELPADQWRCTMVKGLYCGYPAGLDAVGKALKLDSTDQKLSTGRALIKYFCVPCKPSRTNGDRTRNLPRHDPARWELFRSYCAQDVTTELAVAKKLENFQVPFFVQKEWETDLKINSRGVAVDVALAQSAVELDAAQRADLMAEARTLSGLDNPNSLAQLKSWLSDETGDDVTDVTKAGVSAMLDSDNSDTVKRMLEIRQELGKTSVKKYDAILATVGDDNRVRGLLQFYGANRTGRWAGRLVQVQNLPRTYTEPLGLARELVRKKQKDAFKLVYGSVPDTLSQLIRTCFVASPGKVLVDADFSAIEARVIAWLSSEIWRMDVFRGHGKIYEASASQMFGVPLDRIKKGNPEYALRQKGKIAELALGYQGSVGALTAMGALSMGLTQDDLPDIVARWRAANPAICALWYAVDAAAVKVAKEGGAYTLANGKITIAKEYDPVTGIAAMTIKLPSARKLYYISPGVGENRFGKPSVTYMGTDQTSKKWATIETYGGRIVENLCQAIARDCLAYAVERLEEAGHKIVFHVHDEVVIEADAETAAATLDSVTRIMGSPIPWARDLPLCADGWIGEYYRKD